MKHPIQFHTRDIIQKLQEIGSAPELDDRPWAFPLLKRAKDNPKRPEQYVSLIAGHAASRLLDLGILERTKAAGGSSRAFLYNFAPGVSMTGISNTDRELVNGIRLNPDTPTMALKNRLVVSQEAFTRYMTEVALDAQQVLEDAELVVFEGGSVLLNDSPKGGWEWLDNHTPGTRLFYDDGETKEGLFDGLEF